MAEHDREVSQTGTHDNDHDGNSSDEGHSGAEDNGKNGKPGRKSNPNAQAQRRIQNRVAQREFRLRKQQRIRDLEARVEMLSGSQGQSFEQMRIMMRAVMTENTQLRNVVRQLSEFMADGVGGCLPKMGFTRETFDEFLNRGETDTAFNAFDQYKKGHGGYQHGDDPSDPASKKRKRPSTGEIDRQGGTSSGSPAGPGGINYNNPGISSPQNAMSSFSALLDVPYSQSGPPYPPVAPGVPPARLPAPPPRPGYQNGAAPDRDSMFSAFTGYNVYPLPPPPPPPSDSIMQLATSSAENMSLLAGVEDAIENANPRQLEAGKLIKYHLQNYRNNHNYCLPLSLRPTLVQRTIPHDPIIDGMPHPIMRDRMILLKGRYDLVDCMHSFLKGVTIHGDDVLAHNNWEISETWLLRYGFLIDESVLSSVNRWRKERGDKELSYDDLPSVDEAPKLNTALYGTPSQTLGQL